jgi:hypothetical protein
VNSEQRKIRLEKEVGTALPNLHSRNLEIHIHTLSVNLLHYFLNVKHTG